MNKFLILILSLLLTSCMTTKRIQKHCDDFAAICIVDNIVQIDTVYVPEEFIVYDTIEFKLPPDTIKLDTFITVKNNVANLPPVHREFGLIAADISVVNNQLLMNAYLKDSTILIPDTIIVTKEVPVITQAETKVVEVVPGWVKYVTAFLAVFIILIVVVIFKYRK